MKFRTLLLGAAVAALASTTLVSQAGAVVIADASGNFSVGVDATGALYDSPSTIGFRRNGDGYDPIKPGDPRDSWGVSANGVGSYADPQYAGSTLASSSVAGAANTAVVTSTAGSLSIVQNYAFVGQNILTIDTLITNLSGLDAAVLFQRDVDWDFPDFGSSNITFGPLGSSPYVIDASFYGFEDADPTVAYISSCGGGCNEGPDDLGAGIKIDLGTLGAGETRRFTYYYGISRTGQSVDSLTGQTLDAGAQYVMAGMSQGEGAQSATIGFSFANVPEPTTWAMMLTGFFGLGTTLRRRRAALAA
ncbi:MAG: hypothetical protein JWQ29_2240 [Phenylobacterium sp.]|nr:hypothetical protein [Phenylobacterium sp.]